MDPAGRQRILLRLICGGEVDPAAIAAEDWLAMADLAARHRLEPLLHARLHESPAVPEPLRARWRTVHRETAIGALIGRADLMHTAALLRAGGIEPLLLKGGSLAWHAYPEPALRPMRDIDLLLPADRFRKGYDILVGAGYALAWPPELSLDEIERSEKSPPPLVAPHGTGIELHLRAWFPQGHLEWFCPAPDDAGMFARSAAGTDGLLHPSPLDMLRHLVIHAVFSHRLDCGPLALTDIRCLMRTSRIDWDEAWRLGRDEGWADAARLLLELLHRHGDAPLPPCPARPPAPDDAMLATAIALLFQDIETRKSASILARLRLSGWRGLRQRLTAKSRRSAGLASAGEAPAGGLAGWAAGRAVETLRHALRRSTRRQARELSAFSTWIDASATQLPPRDTPD